MADLKLTNVAKTYGGTVDVLKNINLDIKTGELIEEHHTDAINAASLVLPWFIFRSVRLAYGMDDAGRGVAHSRRHWS